MHVKLRPFTLYSCCIIYDRKSLENAKQCWVILLNLSQHGYWGLLWVESYHEISHATRTSHSLSKSVHAGRSGADLPLPELCLQLEFATVPSLPEKPGLQPPLNHHTRWQDSPNPCVGIPSGSLHSCCLERRGR